MGIFKKERTDGATYDGQGEERKGFIDRIKYNGEADELVWKFPFENLSIGAQLIVNQSQEAIFYKGGAACDVFGPGTHTLSANNIPILQKLVNLPFGSNTPFTAEVWYINKTVKRGIKWGSASPVTIFDPLYQMELQIGVAGEFGVRVGDSALFMTEIVGTLHLATTADMTKNFKALISRKISTLINNYVMTNNVNFSQLAGKTDEASDFIRRDIVEEFGKYGVELVQFDVERIVPIENEQLAEAREIQKQLTRQQRLGYTYQQERQFDVMQTAAGNEGSAGTMMGAGMGLGMGFGIGGAFGNQMGQMAGVMQQPQNQQFQNQQFQQPQGMPPVAPPLPPQQTAYYALVNNAQQGPFAPAQLAQLAQSRQITRDTLVWAAGMAQWTKAGDCVELAAIFGIAPPMPPMPPVIH